MSVSSGGESPRYDYRAEMYGDESGGAPFWVSVVAPDGHERDAAEALKLISSFVGPFEDGVSIVPVVGRVEWIDVEGWFFHRDEDHGRLRFWEVNDV